MNQTKKRLQIIKLAISIGDTETIQLQMLKLSPLKTDEKIQEIIRGLQAENYAQTQALITEYIETPIEEILQRTSQHKTETDIETATEEVEEDEEAIIEEFDLFRVKPESDEEEIEEILDLEGFGEKKRDNKSEESDINFDALLNLKSEDVLANNIEIEKIQSPEDDFFSDTRNSESYNYTEVIEKDDFFHDIPSPQERSVPEDDFDALLQPVKEALPEETETQTDISNEPPSPLETGKEPVSTEEREAKEPLPFYEKKKDPENRHYEAIPYIDQKLKNMLTQYPPLVDAEETYASVDAWLLKISNEGYTESEVEEMITYIQKLDKEGKKAEAAQLLLISAATHSKYAQFMLARSLFKGDLLEKNLPEAFTLINRLAMDDEYAEAICDLGQLYENGIGISKDKKRAEALYKEAMELGIKRASAHYERVHRENKGLFGRLFSKK